MQTDSVVYVLHDDVQVRQHLRQIVQETGHLVAEVFSVDEFLDTYDDSRDSCLVSGLGGDAVSAIDLLASMENQSVQIPVVFISAEPDFRTAIEVMKRGAVTVLETPLLDEDLHDAIKEAVQRDVENRERNLRVHTIRTRLASLTDKERHVLDLVVDGIANKVIAKRLGVSIRTVESRRQSIFQKMQVQSLAELVRSVVDAQ